MTDLSLPTVSAALLADADRLLLAPSGLDHGKLSNVLASIHARDVDFADLYFQHARFESWNLEEGIVKSGSFNIDRGVGVRAVAGDKQAYAYSDDISLPALEEAASAVRAIGRQGQSASTPLGRRGTARNLYPFEDPVLGLSESDKVALLTRLERKARDRDSRVVQVMASLTGEHETVLIARSDGLIVADVRPLVRLSLTLIVEENGRREQGFAGGGGRFGYANLDDEGHATQRTVLIEDGILRGYMQDRMNAQLTGVPFTGNGRRESFAHLPMPRMTNTLMLAGAHDPQEIIASVKNGLYAVNFGGGQVDITSGKFVFSAAEAWMIEDGKVTYPVKGATLIGNGPDALTRVSMVGNDLALDSGIGTCGKDGQSVPVGVGQPTLRVDALTVGGTG